MVPVIPEYCNKRSVEPHMIERAAIRPFSTTTPFNFCSENLCPGPIGGANTPVFQAIKSPAVLIQMWKCN